jgi:DsbE subfamily thiol:disulfide oxidoreductase
VSALAKESTNVGRRRLLVLTPLVIFLGLLLLFLIRLGSGDPSRIPSALIGHPAPQTDLPPLAGLDRNGAPVPGLDPASFKGAVTVVNVWASWCVPCHDEAPLLMQLAQDGRLRLVGINYKDELENGRRFLGRYGNPFAAVGADRASTAFPRPLSSAATPTSLTSWSGRSRPIISPPCSSPRSRRRWQGPDSSFRGLPKRGAGIHNSSSGNMDFGLAAVRRSGMTAVTPPARLRISSTADIAARRTAR